MERKEKDNHAMKSLGIHVRRKSEWAFRVRVCFAVICLYGMLAVRLVFGGDVRDVRICQAKEHGDLREQYV